MHYWIASASWFVIVIALRTCVQLSADARLYDIEYRSATPRGKVLLLTSIVLTLLYFPAFATAFYCLYWALVWTLGGFGA